MVRMSLEGAEVAVKLTGSAAKEIALLLIAALKSNEKSLKLRGKERLTTMLKSGKPLEIFSVKESDLKKFMQGAKEYGIVYCVLKNSKSNPDGLCDIFVKADDAPKISRLAERFKFATVDKASLESELVAEKAARAEQAGMEPEAPDITDTEKLLDDLMGTEESQAEPDTPEPEKTEPEKEPDKEKEQNDRHPFSGSDPQTTPPSETISADKEMHEKATSSRPSLKEKIREIKATGKAKEEGSPKQDERIVGNKAKTTQTTTKHRQPQGGKLKSKKGRARG
jgi:hypothetical protein